MKNNTHKTIGRLAVSALLALLAGSALAQSASADGEIRKLDVGASRVVIKHGEWSGMQMGAMTMGFKVRPASLLNGLKVSDKVHIAIAQEGNDFVVTAIEVATPAARLAVAATGMSAE